MDESKKKNISNTEIKSSAFTAYFSEPENAALPALFCAGRAGGIAGRNGGGKYVIHPMES